MDFGVNKTHVEIIKEGAFGGTCFRGIYSGVNCKILSGIESHGKNLMS